MPNSHSDAHRVVQYIRGIEQRVQDIEEQRSTDTTVALTINAREGAHAEDIANAVVADAPVMIRGWQPANPNAEQPENGWGVSICGINPAEPQS